MAHIRWQRFAVAALVFIGTAAGRVQAQSPSDQALSKSIFRTINIGVGLYNTGDHYGCFRLYQGQAITLTSVVGNHPGLAQKIEAGLTRAEAQQDWGLRATALRETLDEVYAVVNGGKPNDKPLWDRLGGEASVKAVVHDFVLLAATDTKVDFTRGGKYPIDKSGVEHLEKTLVELVSAVSGGPLKYSGRDMKTVHAGMGITNAQFDALAGDLIATLNKYKVAKADQDELIKAIAATRKEIVEGTSAPAPPTVKNLFERLGGEAAIVAVVDDFVARAATDPKVNFTRKGTAAEWAPTPENVAHLKKMLVQLITVTTGGPGKYEGKNMKAAHKGMGITKEEFSALAADLQSTLDKFKVSSKDQAELMKIVGSTAGEIIEVP